MGKIRYRSGPISFKVELDDGRVVRRHADHIRTHTATPKEYNYDQDKDDYCQGPISEAQVGNQRVPVVPLEPPPLRRSERVRHPPNRYEPDD